MAPRHDLQLILESILGSRNVYFQPPPNIQMAYPCIIYKRSYIKTMHADNLPYNNRRQYELIVVDRNPDSTINDEIQKLPSCSHQTFYAAEDLNHDVYEIYF